MKRHTHSPRAFFRLLLPALFALGLAACGSDDDDDDGGGDGVQGFLFFTTNQGAAASTRVVTSGTWLAFLADEATSGPSGTDLNGDMDFVDAVPVAVDGAQQFEYVVPAAARDIAWIGAHLYLVVDEAVDALDWNGDMAADDLVLLHWTAGGQLAWVDDLDARGAFQIAAVGDTLFYASTATPAGAMSSSLRALAAAAPQSPQPVLTGDTAGPLRPFFLGLDEGLLLLGLDEVLEARDLNGDLDMDDRRVMALLDATGSADPGGYSIPARNLRLAASSAGATSFRALSKGANDWLACFLVNELAQGVMNLNAPALFPPSWFPAQCSAPGDVDSLDDVLFWVRVAAWSADPMTNPPVNTGLAGEERVLAAGDFVATISPEADAAGCALNGDGDATDRIFRWVRASSPPMPPTAVELLRAVRDVAGGSRGAAELSGRFVIALDEVADGRDVDGNGLLTNAAFVGWIDPEDPFAWTFDHEPDSGAESYGVATWIGELPGRERLGVAFSEAANGFDINGDGDAQDSIPTFAQFASDPNELLFPGFGVACPPDDAGIVLQNGFALYRVSELADVLDWNGDGDLDDLVLFRTRLTDGVTIAEAVLNAIPGRPAAEPASDLDPAIGAFLADEARAGDLNGDGRANAFVLRYYLW